MAIIKAADGTADPVLTNLVAQDKVRFWMKPNLRRMYIFLFLCCMGVEMTSGFDSQLINTMLFTEPYLLCEFLILIMFLLFSTNPTNGFILTKNRLWQWLEKQRRQARN